MAPQSLSVCRRHTSTSDDDASSTLLESVDHSNHSPHHKVTQRLQAILCCILHLLLVVLHFGLFIISVDHAEHGVVVPVGSTANILTTLLSIGLQAFYTVRSISPCRQACLQLFIYQRYTPPFFSFSRNASRLSVIYRVPSYSPPSMIPRLPGTVSGLPSSLSGGKHRSAHRCSKCTPSCYTSCA